MRCEVRTTEDTPALEIALRFRSKDSWEGAVERASEAEVHMKSPAGLIGVELDHGKGRYRALWTCESWSLIGVPVASAEGYGSDAAVADVTDLMISIARAQGCDR